MQLFLLKNEYVKRMSITIGRCSALNFPEIRIRLTTYQA